jgi:hypothetical protein
MELVSYENKWLITDSESEITSFYSLHGAEYLINSTGTIV